MPRLAPPFIAFAALATGLAAQSARPEGQQPRFRANVDLIRVDVVVTDADGRPVRGLTEGDFAILDAGVPRRVAAFSEISHDEAPRPPISPVRRDVADNASADSDRLIVIVLDDLHFSAKTDQVKEMARRVVTGLGPHASLALVTTSGSFGVEPTEDRARLLEEIDAFLDRFTPGRKVRGRVVLQPHLGSRGSPTDLGWFFANMTQYKVLDDVAARIRANDGRRKAFVWISGGNVGASGNADGDHVGGWYRTAQGGALHSMRRSGVVTYAVDTGDFDAQPLREVTAATGGFVLSADRFEQGAARLLADLDHYYLLGFYPENASRDEYRRLEVRVRRPDLTVRHRQGYVAAPPPAPRNRDPLAQLAEGVLPAPALPLRMTAAAIPPSGRTRAQMAIAIEVLAARAPLADADGRMRDTLTYSVWAVDLKKKKATRSVARKVTLALQDTPESGRAAGPVRYQVQTRLELPAGRYQLRASASSERLKSGGSVFLETTMPEYRQDAVGLGGILLGFAGDPRVPRVGDRWPAGLPDVQPTLDREFTPADALRVFCDVIAPAGARGRLIVTLLEETGATVRTLEERDLGQRAPVDLTLPLSDFSGRYILRIDAVAATASVRRETAFAVR